jgi:hypothetical protein
LAAYRKVELSPLDVRTVPNGEVRGWTVGTYVCWFNKIDVSNTQSPRSFNIPKDCDAAGVVNLR